MPDNMPGKKIVRILQIAQLGCARSSNVISMSFWPGTMSVSFDDMPYPRNSIELMKSEITSNTEVKKVTHFPPRITEKLILRRM